MVSNLGNRGEKGGARVEAVVSNHMEASFRETALVLQHAVQVLQMKRKKKGGGATDQHQGIGKSTIRGATGKVRGVLATYHIV